jgi:hypothetical protein
MSLAGLEAVDSRPGNANACLGEILKSQHPDGSFGSLRETASGAVIVMRLKRKVPHIDDVKRLLVDGQSADGGYARPDQRGSSPIERRVGMRGGAGGSHGRSEQPTSDLETTYVVGRALHMLRCEPKSSSRCRDFVTRCRNADGGYGITPGQPSQAVATYFAIVILHWLEQPSAGQR